MRPHAWGLIGLAIAVVAGCGVPKVQHDELSAQKEALEGQVDSLLEEKATLETKMVDQEALLAQLKAQVDDLAGQLNEAKRKAAQPSMAPPSGPPSSGMNLPGSLIPPELLQGEVAKPPAE